MSLELLLDGSKLEWHQERLEAWRRGERVAPITVDLALTQACNFKCYYCFAQLQENKPHPIKRNHVRDFIDDCAEVGVKAISLVSDGESTLSKEYVYAIQYAKEKGLDVASGTNGYLLGEDKLKEILPHLTYLRINITAGEERRYQEIMGVKEGWFQRVCQNIDAAVRLKHQNGWPVTLGMQMVLDQRCSDQIIPLSKLAIDLGVDYLIIKHTSDDHQGSLGVDYSKYAAMESDLKKAEAMSTDRTKFVVKWRKIREGNNRPYQRCHGPKFHLQISGSGLVAPCGPLFGEKYKRFHISNITMQRFRDIIKSDKYWEVMDYLSSDKFDAQKDCSTLCLQNTHNIMLDREVRLGEKIENRFPAAPPHVNFI